MSSQYPTPQSYKDALENILGEAKNIYETKKGLGFQTYGQPRIAGFSPEEQAAMSGIAGLVGMGQQYFAPATDRDWETKTLLRFINIFCFT